MVNWFLEKNGDSIKMARDNEELVFVIGKGFRIYWRGLTVL
jgi:hypothetical protein